MRKQDDDVYDVHTGNADAIVANFKTYEEYLFRQFFLLINKNKILFIIIIRYSLFFILDFKVHIWIHKSVPKIFII